MSVNVFRLLFFLLRLSNVLSVNTKSLFKLSSGLSNIFLIATAANNHIRLGVSRLKLDFKTNGRCQLLYLKRSASIIQQKQLFPHFFVLKVGLFVAKFEENKSLFKLDGCLLQSINLCFRIFCLKFSRFGGFYIFPLLLETRLDY